MRELLDLLRDLPVSNDLLTALVPVVVGLVAAARHYRRTGRLPLTRLPWRALRRAFYAARRELFTNGRPSHLVALDVPLETARTRFAENGYVPEWPLSYHYHGEDANLCRYYHDATRDYPHRQLHVRLFVEDGTTQVYAHEEPSALLHPKAHLSDSDMSGATEWAAQAWRDAESDAGALDPRLWAAEQ